MSNSQSGAHAGNRLAHETSPYLLQHKDNPVDWYPWGDEAFEAARATDRPILLSIGYSACHWCHVMEHESFEDEETARIMNEGFVNVKVDREERPDVDSLYMTAVQQMTGHGGWPMTVFLTPEGEPFYGGTYYPPEPRHGMPSFRQVLLGISDAWSRRRDEVHRSAGELTGMLQRAASMRPPQSPLHFGLIDAAVRQLGARYDPYHGGFGRAPKFPQPMVLELLLRHWRRTGSERSLEMATHTLRQMAHGGMYDQLGGGFHRYSVDAEWLAPHFEKMLYDNALLCRAYVHAFQATGDAEFRRVVEEVLDYVLREMTSPEGGFYSTQDADSEGEEGKFYLWTPEEVDAVLGPREGPLFRAFYDVTADGNFEGKSILRITRGVDEVAAEVGVDATELREVLARGRERLYEARARRVWPARDEKVLTSWNGMMLRAFADAGRVLDRPDYVQAATRNADFIRRSLWSGERLLRTYKDGTAKIDAFLEDHALLVDGLVSLYQATFDAERIREATRVADRMLELFWSDEEGLFYDASSEGERLIVRPRDTYDNATPSGNSAATLALLRLSALTGERRFESVATRVLEGMSGLLTEVPQAFGELLSALDWHLSGGREVAIVGRPGASDTGALLQVLRESFLPNTVIALRDPEAATADDAAAVPLLADREMVGGRAAAYVCRRFACRRPVTDPGALREELRDEGERSAG